MKRFILSFALMFITLFGTSQIIGPAVSSPAQIINSTTCDVFVQVISVDAFCNNNVQTVLVPASSFITTPTPPPGFWIEGAIVTETIIPVAICYAEAVRVPWSICFMGFNTTETDFNCCLSGLMTVTWLGVPAVIPAIPTLVIS